MHDPMLETVLQTVEPRVRLISERHLLLVLEYLDDAGEKVTYNTDLPWWISHQVVQEASVPVPNGNLAEEGQDRLLLITTPHDRQISDRPRPEQLLVYWRVLHQAAVMGEIDRKAAGGTLSADLCLRKLNQYGGYIEREIRFVCGSESLVADEAGAIALYRAFAAAYLDLRTFEPHKIEEFFPSLPRDDSIERMLAEDLDLAALLSSSRPAGAASPPGDVVPIDEAHSGPELNPDSSASDASVTSGLQLQQRAEEAESRGNHVRAAILFNVLAARAAGAEQERRHHDSYTCLARVVDSLGTLFAWDEETSQEWKQALNPLLVPASSGFWPRAARCLYELQRIPGDLSQPVYAVDLPEVIRTFGRKPLKRLLPHARPVLLLMHLKRAHNQMIRSGLDQATELRLDVLFHHQISLLEKNIRREFTPIVMAAFTRSGFVPATTVEKVALDKLVAELLDRICERGYLRIGDVRDAIARNSLKMPDLAGIGEFIRGDALLRVNAELADALDGVYRRGEIYLRSIQRFSSLFFGTKIGRLITIYLAIPFGGAFLALMFAEEVHHLGGKLVEAFARPAPRVAAANQPPTQTAQGQAKPPSSDKIQATDVEWDTSTEEVIWYPADVVTSDEVETNDEGEPVFFDTPAKEELAAQIFTSSATTAPPAEEKGVPFLIAWPTIVSFGIFLLLMFHVPPVRRVVFRVLGTLWWAIRGLLWDIPVGIWRSSTLRSVRQSRAFRFLIRHFWSPTLITLLLVAGIILLSLIPWIRFNPWVLIRWGVGLWFWVVLTLAYNTPWGWVIQDRFAELVSDWWRIIRKNLLPGLITTIIDLFRMLANWVERQLYAVDEWLRYRDGDSQGSLALKAIMGLLWFPIAYAFRFIFYLLVEPQINPVKHFPVVTVSHKVIWPMVPQIAETTGLSPWTVGMFVNGIPGIFGFMAWELKENWRLYQANLPPKLNPVTIGSHGETMRRLLRPGFHSGTVPKIYRKLRHAVGARASRCHHDLEHLAITIEQFATREIIDLLRQCPDWGNTTVHVEGVRFGCQRLVIDFSAEGLGPDDFSIAFENINDHVEAAIEQMGWVDKLTAQQQSLLIEALRGLLDMAAVETINGRTRCEGSAALGPGFDELGRKLTRAEWVENWNRNGAKVSDFQTNKHCLI